MISCNSRVGWIHSSMIVYFVGTVSYTDHDLTKDMTMFLESTLSLKACFEFQVTEIRFVDNLNRTMLKSHDRTLPTTYFSITPDRLNSLIRIWAFAFVRNPKTVNHVPSFPLSLTRLKQFAHGRWCWEWPIGRLDLLCSLTGMNKREVIIGHIDVLGRLFHSHLCHQSKIER